MTKATSKATKKVERKCPSCGAQITAIRQCPFCGESLRLAGTRLVIRPTYFTVDMGGAKARVTVPEHDAGRDMEAALDALRAIAGWASDEGPLKGKGPMDVSAFAAATLKKLEE